MNDQTESLSVPSLDLKAQYRQIKAEVMEALAEVCAGQQFILGPRVKEFEETLASDSPCRYGGVLSVNP